MTNYSICYFITNLVASTAICFPRTIHFSGTKYVIMSLIRYNGTHTVVHPIFML